MLGFRSCVDGIVDRDWGFNQGWPKRLDHLAIEFIEYAAHRDELLGVCRAQFHLFGWVLVQIKQPCLTVLRLVLQFPTLQLNDFVTL